jgi:hypothetical protein
VYILIYWCTNIYTNIHTNILVYILIHWSIAPARDTAISIYMCVTNIIESREIYV